MRTKTMAAVLTSALLLAACTSTDHKSGDAAPAGSAAATTSASGTTPSSTPSAGAATSPGTSTGASTSRAAGPVLGPLGYGALRLGMTKEQALATGLVTAFEGGNPGCALAYLRDAPSGLGHVLLSQRLGVAAIEGWTTAPTPEGVRAGTSATEARRVYPDWTIVDGTLADGRQWAKVPGNDKALYRITTTAGKVQDVTLQLVRQDCYE